LRRRLKPTNDSWRADETYIRVKGKLVYLYRAVDSSGATIDFLLSAKRDAAAAECFQSQSLGAVRTIRCLGSSTPTRTLLTLRLSCNKPKLCWRKTAAIDPCNISTMFWNRIIGVTLYPSPHGDVIGAQTSLGEQLLHLAVRK
jgi:hypothetical protein